MNSYLLGEEVNPHSISESGTTYSIDVSNFKAGIYLIQ